MSPSRRQYIGVIGVTVALSGCSMLESKASSDTNSNQAVSDAFEARLIGPESAQPLFSGSGITRVGEVDEGERGAQFPFELSDRATASVTETFREANVSGNASEFDIQLRDDAGVMYRLGVSPGLATAVEDGEWGGEFLLRFEDRAAAVEVRSRLLGETQESPPQ